MEKFLTESDMKRIAAFVSTPKYEREPEMLVPTDDWPRTAREFRGTARPASHTPDQEYANGRTSGTFTERSRQSFVHAGWTSVYWFPRRRPVSGPL